MTHFLNRRLALAAVLTAFAYCATAQTSSVGIGTTMPDASAALDVTAPGKGALLPRLSELARTSMGSPAPGLIVYQTDGAQPGFYYNAGTRVAPEWRRLADGGTLQYDPATGVQVGPGPVEAAQPVTVGSNSFGRNTFFGASPYLNNARTQILLQGAALRAAGLRAGPLTSVAFFVITKNTTAAFQGFTIKMAHTTAFTANSTLLPNATTVYAADYATVPGWNTHQFTTPFVWDGSSNVALEICYAGNFVGASPDAVANYGGQYLATACLSGGSGLPCDATRANSSDSATSGIPQLRLGQAAGRAYTLPARAGQPGQVLTQQADGSVAFATPPRVQLGTHSLVAAAYGTVGSSGTIFGSTDNFTVARTGTGSYRVSFPAGSELNTANLGTAAVTATLFGATPGLVSYGAGTGYVDVFTFNSSGAAADRGFSFSVFVP